MRAIMTSNLETQARRNENPLLTELTIVISYRAHLGTLRALAQDLRPCNRVCVCTATALTSCAARSPAPSAETLRWPPRAARPGEQVKGIATKLPALVFPRTLGCVA